MTVITKWDVSTMIPYSAKYVSEIKLLSAWCVTEFITNLKPRDLVCKQNLIWYIDKHDKNGLRVFNSRFSSISIYHNWSRPRFLSPETKIWLLLSSILAGTYIFKVKNRSTRKSCEICSKFTINSPERRLSPWSNVCIANFEQVNSGWDMKKIQGNLWNAWY